MGGGVITFLFLRSPGLFFCSYFYVTLARCLIILHATRHATLARCRIILHTTRHATLAHCLIILHATRHATLARCRIILHATRHATLLWGGWGGGGGVITFLFLRFCGSFSATTSSSFMILPLVQICFYLLIMPLGFRNSRYCDSIQSKLADCFKGSISISTLVYILRFFSCFWMPVDFD